jgi:hypothetical protein
MNDEGRDGTHAKPAYLYSQQGNRCSLCRFVIQIQLKVCFAVLLSIGSGCV